MGVDSKYLQRIFEPFFRLHDRERSGSGLGLAICKRIVEIYHGHIWAESPAAGGMIVYVSFPNELIKEKTAKKESLPAAQP
jgi:signal transduction histidine kinase